ncbi:MAG TPA: type IV pili twitching motility protein PilT [Armatimonadetes bacterium]|jgi:twitching motility protein PilT|nr:type IV pilus twitching motility protein PilT [Armatimonadota bacterium]HCD99783.1 type IV pili twitching motility protein PilT [Armatimonadota bacterium]
MQSIDTLLRRCVEMRGSDLHFKADTGRVYVRVDGDLVHLEDVPTFDPEEFRAAFFDLLRRDQIARFEEELELDFAYEIPGVSRFRGNAYQQRSVVQAAFRVIPYEIQTMEELQLPEACYDFVTRPRGLVLVTGPAGSGKSTTQAAMIDRINRTQALHIVTVEDPIEFVHEDRMSLVNQRELDVDTNSFANALKYVLRQDPDVILVGEMRDLETIHLAITAAETGHLVFGTLHTVDAVQTVDRVVDVFPMHQQQQVRMQLSVNLVGVLSQTLVKRKDGRGRVAAFETLVATSAVRNLIRENKTYQIASMIQTGARQKMQTLDQSLASLVERGLVTVEDARSRAKDAMEFDRLLDLGVKAAVPTPGAGQQPGDGVPKPPSAVRGQPNRPGYRRE